MTRKSNPAPSWHPENWDALTLHYLHSEAGKGDLALIAAAPDYHKAARAMIDRHDVAAIACNFDRCGCPECQPFRVIIAKAEGR
jgi:hypothetical protein